MKIEVRNDRIIIDGYVNAVGRDSRPITTSTGRFVEQVKPGAFRASLEKRKNVDLLLNHRKDRKLGSTETGEITLREDNIGLRAHAEVTDADVIEKGRSGKLRGWSFGMVVGDDNFEERAGDIPRRYINELDFYEVSLIDNTMLPCYAGTSVECRADGDTLAETRVFEDDSEIICGDVPSEVLEAEKRLAAMRATISLSEAEHRRDMLKIKAGYG